MSSGNGTVVSAPTRLPSRTGSGVAAKAPGASRSACLLVAVAATLAVTLGCSSIPSVDPDVLAPDEAQPLPEPVVGYRVGVLPLLVDSEFEQHRQATNEGVSDDHRRVMPLDPETRRALISETVQAVRSIRAVQEIRLMEGVPADDVPGALATGWDEGFDLVLRPVLRRHDTYHVKTLSGYVPSLIMWLCLSPIPTWFLATERFGAEVALSLELYSTSSRVPQRVSRTRVQADVAHDFDDFDQGFNLFNPFITPGGMSEGQWERVGARLLPLARREAQRELVRWMRDEDGLRGTLAQADPLLLHKSLALLIGRNAREGRGRQMAEQDMARLRDALVEQAGGGRWLQPWMIELLDGPRVSRDSVQRVIQSHLVRRMRQGDHALLALALHGTWDEAGEPVLILGDTPGQRVSVAELAATLAELPGKVAVVAAVNWVASPESPVEVTEAPWPWEALTALDHVALFTATAGPWQPVLEVEQLPGSVFVAELARVLRNAAGERELSWAEIAAALTPNVQSYARREGSAQVPVLAGGDSWRSETFFRAVPAQAGPVPSRVAGDDETAAAHWASRER